ncbi:GGDEF domain-containing protein [Sulfuritalea hydrogenivorans]|nr:GGDEF domain-containing protein [Sulfuritalea hydrogenivorans]MDK9713489.1 GGDEF domain-containing protein [Sulfuritalea sp.]
MSAEVTSSAPNGQMVGVMLAGLVKSLTNVKVMSGEHATQLTADIEADAWYPMSTFFSVLDEIQRFGIDLDPVLFQAGITFVRDWFGKFDGRSMFPSAAHFIRMQGNSGGYSMVHRGDAEEIGWQDLLELDESACCAKIVCVTPYPREFERGIFHGGVLMTGDVDYVHVESSEEHYNRHLSKKTITIQYHRKSDDQADDSLDAFLAGMSPSAPVVLPDHLQKPMAWRLKAVQEQHSCDKLFFEQSSLLLSKAASRIYELSQTLDHLAHYDELTETLNRRAVFDRAEAILTLAARHRWPVSFIMLDIDHFKSINDTWGHAIGDEALRSVVVAIRSRLRESDLMGRIGGEEFLVVLPQTELEGAFAVAENLRAAVENLTLPVSDKATARITISLGVAIANSPHAETVGSYIGKADQALYRSKRNGRNRVTVFSR